MNRARLVSRYVTGVYEAELRTLGLRGSQLNLLAAIAYMGAVRRSDLAKVMHIDISTLTRNLRVMETNEWIAPVVDRSDGRGAPIRITKSGKDLLARATPLWRTAQRRISAELLGQRRPHRRSSIFPTPVMDHLELFVTPTMLHIQSLHSRLEYK